jgi:hypothetical protein
LRAISFGRLTYWVAAGTLSDGAGLITASADKLYPLHEQRSGARARETAR